MWFFITSKKKKKKSKIRNVFMMSRITWKDKALINGLMKELNFLCEEKIFSKIEKKNNIFINVFCYGNNQTFPIYISNQKFKNSIDVLLVMNENKSYHVYIKDFYRFMFHKTKNKNKKYICKSCLQCFSSKSVLIEHIEVCFSINDM